MSVRLTAYCRCRFSRLPTYSQRARLTTRCHPLQRTNTKKATVNPEWKQDLFFEGELSEFVNQAHHMVSLHVHDHDERNGHASSEAIGRVDKIDVSWLKTTKQKKYNEKLHTQGTLEFTIRWIDGE